MTILENRKANLKYIFIDTPGQIEVFNWSASGTIITDTLASSFPTTFVYVADTPRCVSPNTFMSNMLYACSILYKTRLPLVLAFNKVDVTPHDFAEEWMKDSQAFDEACRTGGNYMANLTQSMGLMLQEFYEHLTTVGVSARTGIGMDTFFEKTLVAVKEYELEYLPELLSRISLKQEKEAERQREQMAKVSADMKATGGVKIVSGTKRTYQPVLFNSCHTTSLISPASLQASIHHFHLTLLLLGY
jgi:GTPase SAR1 family protein